MTYQSERDEFIATFTRELSAIPAHIVVSVATKLLRAASTLHRLAEAQCNGDYPFDNGERKVVECSRCGTYAVRSSMVADKTQPVVDHYRPIICQDCRAQDRVTALLKPLNIEPIFNGDPRGAVLKLKVPSGHTNDWGREGIYVPARSR